MGILQDSELTFKTKFKQIKNYLDFTIERRGRICIQNIIKFYFHSATDSIVLILRTFWFVIV